MGKNFSKSWVVFGLFACAGLAADARAEGLADLLGQLNQELTPARLVLKTSLAPDALLALAKNNPARVLQVRDRFCSVERTGFERAVARAYVRLFEHRERVAEAAGMLDSLKMMREEVADLCREQEPLGVAMSASMLSIADTNIRHDMTATATAYLAAAGRRPATGR